jgi:hypothetical protein
MAGWYGLGTMTNDLEATEKIFDKSDYETMLILGVASTVKRELRKLRTTFGGFIPPPHREYNIQDQHVITTLPHINGLEQEIRCILSISPAPTGHTT